MNKLKDKRVEITTEVIVGIKYIKLYGWEIAFKKIIQNIRDQETEQQIKLAFRRSFERAFGSSISFISSLAIYILAFHLGKTLTFPIIFSVLQTMITTKRLMVAVAVGGGIYHEIKVTFDRFAHAFNIKNRSMVQIPPKNGHPVSSKISKSSKYTVRFENFDGYWKTNLPTPSLKNINYCFLPKTLYGVTGRVGSGKSGLLGAILG